jgi:hypothetical protein
VYSAVWTPIAAISCQYLVLVNRAVTPQEQDSQKVRKNKIRVYTSRLFRKVRGNGRIGRIY